MLSSTLVLSRTLPTLYISVEWKTFYHEVSTCRLELAIIDRASVMAWHSLHLLVLALACSHLIITSNAVPVSRTKHLLHESAAAAAFENLKQMMSEKATEEFIEGRMDIQINDYPPTGPNTYHTPKPPRG